MDPSPPLRALTALLATATLGIGLWLAASAPSTATVAPSALTHRAGPSSGAGSAR